MRRPRTTIPITTTTTTTNARLKREGITTGYEGPNSQCCCIGIGIPLRGNRGQKDKGLYSFVSGSILYSQSVNSLSDVESSKNPAGSNYEEAGGSVIHAKGQSRRPLMGP